MNISTKALMCTILSITEVDMLPISKNYFPLTGFYIIINHEEETVFESGRQGKAC
jgi:hypothetical protein